MIETVNNKVFAYNPTTCDIHTIAGRFNYIRPKHIHIIFDLNHLANYHVLSSLGYYAKYETHWLSYLFDKIKPYLRDTEDVVNPNKDTHITFTLISDKTNIPLKELVEVWMSYYNIKPYGQFSYFVQPMFQFKSNNNIYYQIYITLISATFNDNDSKCLKLTKDEYSHNIERNLEFTNFLKKLEKEENNNV